MDKSVCDALLGFFGWFSGTIVLVSLVSVYIRSSKMAVVVRGLSIIPNGIYAILACIYAFGSYGREAERLVRLSHTLHAAAGLGLLVWNVLGAYLAHGVKADAGFDGLNWSSRKRWHRLSLIFVVDILFIPPEIYGCVVASDYLPHPWTLDACSSTFCYTEVVFQALAIINILRIIGMLITVVPLMVIPRPLVAFVFYLLRALHSMRLARQKMTTDNFAQEELSKDLSLGILFQHDAVAIALSRQLHLDDIVNVSRASKNTYRSVFMPYRLSKASRRELLCENACKKDTKAECWACSKVICEACKVTKTGIPRPRTRDHVEKCYAICTRCYFLGERMYSAPFRAAFRQTDLSVQHNSGCTTNLALPVTAQVCRSCAALEAEEIRDIRERRDEEAVSRSLAGKIRCRGCEIVLPAGSRRWWVCDSGGHHMCNWAGHGS